MTIFAPCFKVLYSIQCLFNENYIHFNYYSKQQKTMKKSLLTLVMALVSCVMVMAQVTTSSLAGIVTDAEGEVIGATVQAVHTPSGTHYGVITNEKGAFAIRGMRVGGPYEITVSYIGATTQKFTDVNLALGETFTLNVELKESAEMLENVVVVGSASKFTSIKTGAVTNINKSMMENLPTVSRSITDMTRLSPYGGNGMSFAGADGRTANFTIDGASFNQDFGLSSALPGGGNPVSIEAIQEMQVVVSPFDARETGFIGGGVNAITKSGNNTFEGSAYVYHRNEYLHGKTIDHETMAGVNDVDRNTLYGVTLGGPIIKDKLFFFANYEYEETPSVATRWRGSEDGKANPDQYISRTKLSDLEKVSNFVKQKYGYDTGSWTDFPSDENTKKFLIRLDWNINDNHHLAVRYNYTKNLAWSAPNATSMDGGSRASGARMSQYSMSFANSMYSQDHIVHSYSIDLNSRLSENLSNQFIATYSKKDDVRGTNSSPFPFIDIQDGDGQNYMALGYELFTWNNGVHNTTWNIKDDVTYYYGNHKLTAGLSYEHQMADNAYMRNGTGYYRYATLDDFLNEAAPEIVNLTYGYGGETNPAARVQYNKAGIYLNDSWTVNKNFNLTAGIRFDGLFYDNSDLMTNKAILDFNDANIANYDVQGANTINKGHKIDTGKWPNTHVSVSPRVGFSWDVFGDATLKVRGGSGFFEGRIPLVFFTNMPTNGAMVQYNGKINGTGASSGTKTDMSQFAGGLVCDANGKPTIDALKDKFISLGHPATISPEDGVLGSSIIAVDPDFVMPQIWKTSLAVDYQLPVDFPFTVGVEGIYGKNINAVSLTDWSVPEVGGFARFNGVDDRPIYPANYRGTFVSPTTGKRTSMPTCFVLTNNSKGYSWSGVISLNTTPAEWINISASYTHQVSKEITGMPGSDASSAFYYVPCVEGPNNIKLHNSQYVTPDRVVASATINDKSGNHYSFIYEAKRGGNNYSYLLSNDMNGDSYNYDALYIPTDQEVEKGLFRFVSEDDKQRFMDFVHKDDYLSDNQGSYAEAYSVYTPWRQTLDFSYKHDFKLKTGNMKHKLTLSADVKNILNLFNDKWGVEKYLNPAIGTEARILKYEGVDADGFATFSTPKSINGDTDTFVTHKTLGQCWYMSIGLKYTFN